MKNKRFEEYFLKYKNLVIRIVMDKTGDYQAAQEICQQVFVSFYSNMDKVAPELVKAWLMRCAQNAVIDYFRKLRNKKEIFVDTPVLESGNNLVEESLKVYEDRLNNRELVGRILREVREVNEQWFEVLVMHCIDGLSYAEMAEKLGISEPVLRARMYRARTFIKERFKEEFLE